MGRGRGWERIIWQTDEADEIATTVGVAVARIEALCRPLLEDSGGSGLASVTAAQGDTH